MPIVGTGRKGRVDCNNDQRDSPAESYKPSHGQLVLHEHLHCNSINTTACSTRKCILP